MSILLYVAGALFFAIGAAAIGYGIPVGEFSFGNTLIIAGAVAMTGGLIVMALGVVVSRLTDILDAAPRGVARPPRPQETAEPAPVQVRTVPPQAAATTPAARVPFPPKPKAPARVEAPPPLPAQDFAPAEPRVVVAPAPFTLPPLTIPPAVTPSTPDDEAYAPPSLPNPYEPLEQPAFTIDEPLKPAEFKAPEFKTPEFKAAELKAADEPVTPLPDDKADLDADDDKPEVPAVVVSPVLEKSEPSYFDTMWPADEPRSTKPFESKPFEIKPLDEPKIAEVKVEAEAPVDDVAEPAVEEAAEEPREERAPVAILKSGVVDGMGYTLYVDGSIEAELPDGTLRFASINELRAHLEKTS